MAVIFTSEKNGRSIFFNCGNNDLLLVVFSFYRRRMAAGPKVFFVGRRS